MYFFFSPSLSLFLPVSIYLNRLPFAHRCHSLSPHPFSSTHKHSIRNVIPDLRHIRPRVVEAPLCHRSRYRYTFPVYFPSTRVTSLRNPTAQPGLRDSHGGKKKEKNFQEYDFRHIFHDENCRTLAIELEVAASRHDASIPFRFGRSAPLTPARVE